MNALLLWLTLVLQGVPPLPNQGGAVTGVVKTETGSPAANVRVVAMIPPDSPQDVAGIASMATLTETDENGRFRLENVPVGRYIIAAGKIDSQTYYPGYLDVAKASKILVTAGYTLPNINFTLNDSSGGRASLLGSLSLGPPAAAVPFKLAGAKAPITYPGGTPNLVLTNVKNGQRWTSTLDRPSINVGPIGGSVVTNESYKVSIEGLPAGYTVRSMTSGPVDLTKNPFQVAAASFTLPNGSNLAIALAQQLALLGSTGTSATPPAPPPPAVPILNSNSIDIELSYVAPPAPATGIRVSGKFNGAVSARTFSISNIQGTTYTDGTFEFAGVPPGRHVINVAGKAVGAVIVTADKNIEDVALGEFWVLPMNFESQAQATFLPSVSGRVLDETTGAAINQGIVYFSGQERVSFRLQPDGTFRIFNLLPGRYKLEIQVFGHMTVSRDLELAEQNLDVEFRSVSIDAQ